MATLAQLEPGQSGTVRRVTSLGRLGVRLMEMGLVPGARVELLKRAPLGDPLELRVAGYHLSVRKAEAGLVELSGEVTT